MIRNQVFSNPVMSNMQPAIQDGTIHQFVTVDVVKERAIALKTEVDKLLAEHACPDWTAVQSCSSDIYDKAR